MQWKNNRKKVIICRLRDRVTLFSVLRRSREVLLIFAAALGAISAGAQTADREAAIRRDYEYGEQAMRSGNLDAAEQAFRQILKIAPHDVGAHGNLGVIYMRRKQWTPALQELKAAEQLAPRVPGIRLNIGLAYYRQGKYGSAIPPFESVVRDQPQSIQAGRLLGLCYFFKERYADAAGALATLWLSSNTDLSYLYVLSVAAGNAGREELAQRALARLLEVGKDSAELHLFLGKAYLARDQNYKALEELQRAEQANPKLPFVHYNLGVAYRGNGDLTKAKAEFLKDAALEPDVAYNYEQLGIICQSLDQKHDAKLYFQRALKLNHRLGTSWYGLAKMYKEEKQYPEALKALNEAGALDATSASVHYLRAQILTQLGRAAEAHAELATVRSLQRQSADQLERKISGRVYQDPQLAGEQQ
jgi:tetratricopeptide (TPR) repeat protein